MQLSCNWAASQQGLPGGGNGLGQQGSQFMRGAKRHSAQSLGTVSDDTVQQSGTSWVMPDHLGRWCRELSALLTDLTVCQKFDCSVR